MGERLTCDVWVEGMIPFSSGMDAGQRLGDWPLGGAMNLHGTRGISK